MLPRLPLRRFLALAFPLLTALAACADEGVGGLNGRLATTPSGTPSQSTAGTSPTSSPTPTGSPSPAVSASPTPTPTPSPTPVASSVAISPETVKLWLPAGPGVGTGLDLPSKATLSAVVTFSDGSTGSAVTWSSLAPGWIAVSQHGVVSALATDGVTIVVPAGIRVQASSQDGRAIGYRDIVIATDGGIAVSVE